MKKLILCFDGTQNQAEDGEQKGKYFGLGESQDDGISNVLKLHLLLGGDLHSKPGNVFGQQLTFYYSGVGTYGTWVNRLRNSVSAPAHKDVGKIIKQGMKDLFQHYQKGDEIFLFGFSRGAAIARRFASVLKTSYGLFGWSESPNITFLGVFDTVAAIDKPNLIQDDIKPASDVVFENGTISENIKKALHILAIDEKRIAFMPTLMNRNEKVTEVWFAGAHSDIGGGFHHDGLSDITLEFMRDFILDDPDLSLEFLSPSEINYADLFDGEKEYISYDDLVIHPNPYSKNHQQTALTKIGEHFLDDRSVRVNVADKHSIYPPILHRSVLERRCGDNQYYPNSLENNINLTSPYTGKVTPILIWEHSGEIKEYDSIESAMEPLYENYKTLEVGDKTDFYIHANVKYNNTGIFVGRNQKEAYVFEVDMGQTWFDGNIECSPNGWSRDNEQINFFLKPFIALAENSKRYEQAKWFEIVGSIGKNDQNSFKILDYIKKTHSYKPKKGGELYAFANDLLCKYGNNRGSVKVYIQRIT